MLINNTKNMIPPELVEPKAEIFPRPLFPEEAEELLHAEEFSVESIQKTLRAVGKTAFHENSVALVTEEAKNGELIPTHYIYLDPKDPGTIVLPYRYQDLGLPSPAETYESLIKAEKRRAAITPQVDDARLAKARLN
jgi:hypothetical protein